MHIVIDAQLINTAETYRGAGVSVYSQELLTALGRHGSGLRLTAFVNDAGFSCEGVALRRTRWPAQRPLPRIVWEQTALPSALSRLDADVVHGLVNVLPLATSTPGVVTVHDLSFVRMPERFPAAKRFYLTQLCAASVRRAQRVIAVSRQTANDLVHYFHVDAKKIDVVYNGVAERFAPGDAERSASFRRAHDLPARFLLYVGTLEPRKNLERLIDAYAAWRAQATASDRDVALVLAGAQGWFYDTIYQQVQALGLAEMIRFPGYVPSADLPEWYRAALAFVYPSLFEGFGMPVLEAMACGAPVLCSRAPGIEEVAQDAALTFAPDSTAEMAAALNAVVTEDAVRADLRKRGLAHVRRFSWTRCAAETINVYQRTC
ncbi:MAG: glycosyltransferase family 1 protein [Caldilineaceae bacterium]